MGKKQKIVSIDYKLPESDIKTLRVAHDFVDNTPFIGTVLPFQRVITYDNKETVEEKTPQIGFFVLEMNGNGLQLKPWDSPELANEYIIRSEPLISPSGMRLSVNAVRSYIEKLEKSDNKNIMDITDVFNRLRNIISFYMEFPGPIFYTITALWIIGTYFTPVFNSYPYLHLTGLKGSGKTKFLDLCYMLCFNSVKSSNITSAPLFRTVEALGSTLLIDEQEKLGDVNTKSERIQDLRAILLSGYKKNSYSIRMEDTKANKIKQFDVYGPKIIAHITGLDDILEDRCIKIVMLKSLGPQVNRDITVSNKLAVLEQLRYDLYFTYLEYAKQVADLYQNSIINNLYPNVVARERELWLPLLVLAKVVDPNDKLGLVRELLQYIDSLKIEIKDEEEYSYEYIMLGVLQQLYDSVNRDEYHFFSTIKEHFLERITEELDVKYFSAKRLADMLLKLGLTKKRRDPKTRNIQYYISKKLIENIEMRLYNRKITRISKLSQLSGEDNKQEQKGDSTQTNKTSLTIDRAHHNMLLMIAESLTKDKPNGFKFEDFKDQVDLCMTMTEDDIKIWLQNMIYSKKLTYSNGLYKHNGG